MTPPEKFCKCKNHVRNGEVFCSLSCTVRQEARTETEYFSINCHRVESRSIAKPFSKSTTINNEDDEEWEIISDPKQYRTEPLFKSAKSSAASASTARIPAPIEALPWDDKDAFRRSVGDWTSGYKVEGYGHSLELDNEVEKVALAVKPYHSGITGSYVSDVALVFGE